MEFEEQDDHDEEMDMATSYDSLQGGGNNNNNNNSGGGASQLGRAKMAGSSGGGGGEVGATAQSQPRSASNNSRPRYRECLKNHAVGLGGHALDGCGEFLAAGADGTIDALKCAACSCHRNFHRKETDHSASAAAAAAGLRLTPEPYSLVPAPHHHYPQFSQYYRTPAGYLQVRPLALPSTSGGGGAGDDQEDVSDVPNMGGGGGMQMMQYGSTTTSSSGKKRFRTKFTQEQKERMLGLAERLGWRIQKQDEALVQEFCSDTGVRRHVLKVWMHNNKHTLGKKP